MKRRYMKTRRQAEERPEHGRPRCRGIRVRAEEDLGRPLGRGQPFRAVDEARQLGGQCPKQRGVVAARGAVYQERERKLAVPLDYEASPTEEALGVLDAILTAV